MQLMKAGLPDSELAEGGIGNDLQAVNPIVNMQPTASASYFNNMDNGMNMLDPNRKV